ncbi:MAG: DUF1461 domain-containing protein [Clostridia bacterium]|nr:DUF1461 domain-containing protein [Clostridia bacterium]
MKIVDRIFAFLFNFCLLFAVAVGAVFAIASSPAYYYEQFKKTGVYATVDENGVEKPKRIHYIGGSATQSATFTDEQLNEIIQHIIDYLFTDKESFALKMDNVQLNGRLKDDVNIFGEVAVVHMQDVKTLLQTLGTIALICGISAVGILAYFIVRAVKRQGGVLLKSTLIFYGSFVGIIGVFCLVTLIQLLSKGFEMEAYLTMLWRNFHFIIFSDPAKATGSFFDDTLTMILTLDLFMAAVVRVLLIIAVFVVGWCVVAYFLDRRVKRSN